MKISTLCVIAGLGLCIVPTFFTVTLSGQHSYWSASFEQLKAYWYLYLGGVCLFLVGFVLSHSGRKPLKVFERSKAQDD